MILPSIALVTPTLNQSVYLREAVDSVLGQEYRALDYIVMDGGSTDGSQEVLVSYGPRLRWVSKPDAGQSAAINQGWQRTQGEIIGWLNSDDRLAPGALARVGDFFANHPEIEWVYGDCDYINSEGQVWRHYPVCPYNYSRLVVEAQNYIPQPATFFRRRLLETIGWLDEGLHYVMDYDFWLRIGLRHPGVYLPGRLAALRLHAGAKSTAHLGQFASENVLVLERLLSSSDLPVEIATQKRQALANLYLHAADIAFWGEKPVQARRYGIQAWRLRPLRLRQLYLWLLLGPTGRQWAEKCYSNPYLPG